MAKDTTELVFKQNKGIDFEEGKTFQYEYSFDVTDSKGVVGKRKVLVRRSLVPFRYGNQKISAIENHFDEEGNFLKETVVESDRTYQEELASFERVIKKFNKWEGVHNINKARKYTSIDRDVFKTDYIQMEDIRKKVVDVFNGRFIRYAKGKFLDAIAEGLNSRVRRLPGESDDSFRVRLRYSILSHGDPTVAGIESFIYNFFGHHLGNDLREIFVTDEKHVIKDGRVQTSKNFIFVENELVKTIINPFSDRVVFGGAYFKGDGESKVFNLLTDKKPIRALANFGSGLREVIIIDKDTLYESSSELDELKYNDAEGTIEFEKTPIAASDIFIEFERSLGNRVKRLTGRPEEYTIDNRGNIEFNKLDDGKLIFLEYVYITNEVEFIARVFEPFTQILKLRDSNVNLRASSANKYNLSTTDTVDKTIIDREKTVFDYTGSKLYENIVYKTVKVPNFGNNGFIRGEKYGRSIVEIILKLWQRTTLNIFKEVDIENNKVEIEIEDGQNDAEYIVDGTYEISIADPISGELSLARETKKIGSEDFYEITTGQNYFSLYSPVLDINKVFVSNLETKEQYIELANAFVDKGRRKYVLTRKPINREEIRVRVLHRSAVDIARNVEQYVEIPETDWEHVPGQNYVKFHRPLPPSVEKVELTYEIPDPVTPGRVVTRIDDLSAEGTIFVQSEKTTTGRFLVQQTGVYRLDRNKPGIIYFNNVDTGKQSRISFKHTKNIDYSEKVQEMMSYLNEIKAAGVELFLTFFQGWAENLNVKERIRDDILYYTNEIREDLFYLVSDKNRFIGNIEKEPLKFPTAEQFITVILPAGNYGYVQLPHQEYVIPNSVEINYVDGGGKLYRVEEIKPVQKYTVYLEHAQEFAVMPESLENVNKLIVKDYQGNIVDIGDYELYGNDSENKTLKFSGANIRADLLNKVTRNLSKDESSNSASFELMESEIIFNLNEVYDIKVFRKQARTFPLGVLEKTSEHIVATAPELGYDELITISDGYNQWQTTTTGDWGVPTILINNNNFAAGTTPFDYTEIESLFAAKGLMEKQEIETEAAIDVNTKTVVFGNQNLMLEPWDYEVHFYRKTGRYTFEFYENEFAIDYSKGTVFFDESDISKHVLINYLHSRNRPYFILESVPKFGRVEDVKINEVSLVEGTEYTYSLVELEEEKLPTVLISIQIPKSSRIKVSFINDDSETVTNDFVSNVQMRKVFENLSEVQVDCNLHDKMQSDYYNTTPNDYILMHKKDPPYRGMRPGVWYETKGSFTPGSGMALGHNSSMPIVIKHAAKTFYIDRDRIRKELKDKALKSKLHELGSVRGKYHQLTSHLNKAPGNLRRIKLDVKYNRNTIEIWELWPDTVDFVNPAYYGFLGIEEDILYGFRLVEGIDFVYDERTNEIVFLKNLMYETEFVMAYTYNDRNYLFKEEIHIQRLEINKGFKNEVELKLQFPGRPAIDIDLEFNPQTGKYEGFVEEEIEAYPFRFKATDIAGNIEEFNYVLQPSEIDTENTPFAYAPGQFGYMDKVYCHVNGQPVDLNELGNGKFEASFNPTVISSGDERYNVVDVLVVDKSENTDFMTKLFSESEGAYLGATFSYDLIGLVKMYTGIEPTKLLLLTVLEQWKVFHRILDILNKEVNHLEDMLIRHYNEPGAVDVPVCRAFKPLYAGFADTFYPYYGGYGYPYYGYPYSGFSYPEGGFLYGYPYYNESIFGKTNYYSLTNDYVTEEALKRYKNAIETFNSNESIYIYDGMGKTSKNVFVNHRGEEERREIILDTVSATLSIDGTPLTIVSDFSETEEGDPPQIKIDFLGNVQTQPADNVGRVDLRYDYFRERIKDSVLTIDCGMSVEAVESIQQPEEDALTMIIQYADSSEETTQLI